MIYNTDQVIDIIKTATAGTCGNRVYRIYPKAKPKAPYIIADVMTRSAAMIADGAEAVADITFSVDIYAEKGSDAEEILNTAETALIAYGIRCTGATPSPVTPAEYYHLAATFNEIIDKRGHTYTSL